MIIDVKSKKSGERCLNIGTHNGVFHSDEVVGIAILDLVYDEEGVHVVRTRDKEELGKCDIVIDVGGGQYDHHVAGFDVKRETGEMYASAGLIWKDFGIAAIANALMRMDVDLGAQRMFEIKNKIDREYIVPVDMEDNGVKAGTHTFSFIPDFVPSYLEKEIDYDKAFFRAVRVASKILRNIIKTLITENVAKGAIEEKMEIEFVNYCQKLNFYTGVIELESQNVPWLETVVELNQKMENCIRFVIFPYPDGGWAAQCVPPALDRKFEQLIPFPKDWAGKTDHELQEISGVGTASFCHNGRFFARARCKSAIIDMCIIATQVYNRKA